jgi:hypothetical protein
MPALFSASKNNQVKNYTQKASERGTVNTGLVGFLSEPT